jgi:flagellar biosynthesis protein FliQ
MDLIAISQGTVKIILLLGLPSLLVSMVIGLIISVFSAVTQVNDMSLTFVPKMVLVSTFILISLPWIGDNIEAYAKELYKRVEGTSDDDIKTTHRRKSIGISRTFDKIFDRDELKRRVHVLARHLSFAIIKLDVIPTVFHLSISYEMNQKSHKNISLCEIFTEKKFDTLCLTLFNEADIHKRLHVIRLSINCSSFTRDSKKELSLIGFEDEQKMKKLTESSQILREKYGIDTLKWGSEL